MMQEHLVIPLDERLIHPLFYANNAVISVLPNDLVEFSSHLYFLYDAAFYADMEAIKPWEKPEIFLPKLMEEWTGLQQSLQHYFSNRDKVAAAEPMRQGIGICLMYVFWMNSVPVNFKQIGNLGGCKHSPMNADERIAFILNRPAAFQSYVQLSQLMKEMEKKSILITLRKRSK